METGDLYKCEDSTYDKSDDFQFLPIYAGHMMKDHAEIKYSGQCFQDVTLDIEYVPNA